jgi:hypothetical protein
MTMTTPTYFTTIRTEGALLPPDVLQRVAEGKNLHGLAPDDYHLSGQSLTEAINTAWNTLQGAWANFRERRDKLPDDDSGTSLTRERWLLPLFRELDFGRLNNAPPRIFNDKPYPISHAWGDIPLHLVSYKQKLDDRAKGQLSPHSLMQVVLNNDDSALWGIVTNGYQLRLMRDNASLTRQAYVEFDLQAIMDGDIYTDFALLWLLCHQSRFENDRECWLEAWMTTAQNDGTRALDQLRQGVQLTIETLGAGFLSHARNKPLRDALASQTLTSADFYRELLRLVYRLIFLIVAEDRNLLHVTDADDTARARYDAYYSTRRLRHLAEIMRGTPHSDLYESLKWLMNGLQGDADPDRARLLGLPVLGSFLFDNHAIAHIATCQIANHHLLEAMRHLAFFMDSATKTRRPVDYRNLGSEELGSVYESLLELQPIINLEARSFTLAIVGGNERKTTGSYYTPTSLITVLLETALDPVIARAKKQGEKGILALKICDPACGSGHFLIAAAHRIGRALAQLRTGDEEPTTIHLNTAVRDVISHCVYGVDINPMAVELCKVNLWLESLDSGKPLTFLDHRILVGNSLFGTTPALMAAGIPTDALKFLEGDDKKEVDRFRGLNRDELKARLSGQQSIFDTVILPNYSALTRAMNQLEAIPQNTIADIHEIEQRYTQLANDPEYIKARLLADAWCASFVWEKIAPSHDNPIPMPMTDRLYRNLEKDPLAVSDAYRAYIAYLAEKYQFFHWHVAFPDVFVVGDGDYGWSGGFDCVLGNPPWERIKLQEKEWFAQRAPQIANAPNANARKKMIDALKNADDPLYHDFVADLRKAEGESHYSRTSARFPLCGRGDVNTYTLFAETARQLLNPDGRTGIIVPSGIATDDTTKFFFQDVVDTQSLVAFYDFENRGEYFTGMQIYRFSLAIFSNGQSPQAEFAFFALTVQDLENPARKYTLSPKDIALINPNTHTAPTFRTQRDANITMDVYRRIPVLIEGENKGYWGAFYIRLIHFGDYASELKMEHELIDLGCIQDGNMWVLDKTYFLPLYESKFTDMYDHRSVIFTPSELLEATILDKINPNFVLRPRYWISETFFEKLLNKYDSYTKNWFIGYRDVTKATNMRTMISTAFPIAPASIKFPVLGFDCNERGELLVANFNAFIFDYIARQKIGGTSMSFFIMKQLPVLPPQVYTPDLLAFIVPRVAELTYTAWDMRPFAQDIGYDGAPFLWDEERRFVMRCELDALYFHLYGVNRDDVAYIMDTFPIVRRKDEALHGEYLTKNFILACYDQMMFLPKVDIPAPKGDGTVRVPDVRGFISELNPPPADDAVRHEG